MTDHARQTVDFAARLAILEAWRDTVEGRDLAPVPPEED